MQRGAEIPTTLILPVCRQTIELMQMHKDDMYKLAKLLTKDRKTGNLYIKGFKPPRVNLRENEEHILPMIDKLRTENKGKEKRRNLSMEVQNTKDSPTVNHVVETEIETGKLSLVLPEDTEGQQIDETVSLRTRTLADKSPKNFPSVFKSLKTPRDLPNS